MDIILKKNVDKLGSAGEVISVKKGFARNFLLPQGLGLVATPANLKVVEQEKKKEARRLETEKKEAQALAERISSVSCTITVQAGEEGKLFGSVTTQHIAEGYKVEGINIDKRKIELAEPIKDVGVFKIKIKLHPEITAEAKVWIVKE